MRYCNSCAISHEICNHAIFGFWYGILSHEICNHEILRFGCKILWNLQPCFIVILVWYLMKSATMKYFDSGIIFHEICNRDILQLLCIILWNLRPWDIDISWKMQPQDIPERWWLDWKWNEKVIRYQRSDYSLRVKPKHC